MYPGSRPTLHKLILSSAWRYALDHLHWKKLGETNVGRKCLKHAVDDELIDSWISRTAQFSQASVIIYSVLENSMPSFLM